MLAMMDLRYWDSYHILIVSQVIHHFVIVLTLLPNVGITRYKARFGYIVNTTNYVEEDRLA
jgi:hypothetical protein